MLQTIDKALAGAIDIVADDIQATVKSVREQGAMRTLGDAVEDAASLVVGGAGNVVSGLVGGPKAQKTVSGHSGVSSSYADLCAGRGANSFQGGGMSIPAYVPGPKSAAAGRSAAPPASKGGFGPGIGIQRAQPGFNAMPGAAPQAGGVQVFAKGAQGAYGGPQVPAFTPGPQVPAFQPYQNPAARGGGYGGFTGGPPTAPPAPAARGSDGVYQADGGMPGAKEPPISAGLLAQRFDEIRAKCTFNQKCFDCQAPNPEWASVSFGVLLCIECGGHHRQMGTHISRVRSCKMDTWTERQIKIFEHGGNRRLAEFFRANNVPTQTRYQRYHTPAAEWYREAWIKNMVFGKPVPAPEKGVVLGPCKAGNSAAPKAKAAAPPADLLDMGDEPKKAAPAAKAAQADLLGFDEEPKAKEADLLGTGGSAPAAASGDLLNMGGSSPSTGSGDILGLGSAGPATSGLASLDFSGSSQAPAPVAAPATAAPALSLAAPAVPAAQAMPAYTPQPQAAELPAANTLGGGARLVDPPPEEKASDPFAMALEKWGM